MKVAIRLEMFDYGDRVINRIAGIKEPYVKRVTGCNNDLFTSEYINGYLDFSAANSVGSRGVIKHYFVGDGVYEIYERISWKRHRQYYIRVAGGRKREITREEVIQCLQNV